MIFIVNYRIFKKQYSLKFILTVEIKKYKLYQYLHIYIYSYMYILYREYVLILLYELLCKTLKTRSKNIITPLGNRLGTYYVLQNQIKDVVDTI